MSPAIVYAAGLGRLTVNSALGQPLSAEIDLVAVKKEEKSSLTARLASENTFRRTNVDYSPLLSTFKTSIETHPDGHLYVRIISSQPVAEPLLNMLVELNWSSGRLLREYTVLLPSQEQDGHSQAGPATQTAPPVGARAEWAGSGPDSSIGRDGSSPLRDKTVSGTASGGRTDTVYGPVKPGDTLGGIAKIIGLPAGVSFNQMLVALQRANRNAFFGNNIHQLKTGPILRIPDSNEISTITAAEANQEVKVQTADWRRRRFEDVESATEELDQVSAGKIERAAEVSAASDHVLPREILKLSRVEEPRYATNNAGSNVDGSVDGKVRGKESNLQSQLEAMEEDAIARHGSLREAGERIALLEKNIEKLQRLLELRNPALTGMQMRAEAIRPIKWDAATLTSYPASAAWPVSFHTEENTRINNLGSHEESEIALAAADEPVEIARPVQSASLPTARSAPDFDLAPETHTSNLTGDLDANVEYLGGALVLLVTGIVGVSMARRTREAPSDNDTFASTVRVQPSDQTVASFMSQELYNAAGADGMDAGRQTHPERDDIRIGTAKIAENIVPEDCAQSGISGIPASSPGRASSALIPVATEDHALDGIKLCMDNIRFASPSADSIKTGVVERNHRWHEIVSGIDLARAYQEMGDNDAAAQALQRVMQEGDAQQQESARLVLARLHDPAQLGSQD
nr:FimV/HubP family polar landmark protein [Nitrosospira briensis]